MRERLDLTAIEMRATLRRVKDRLARIEERREAHQLADAPNAEGDGETLRRG